MSDEMQNTEAHLKVSGEIEKENINYKTEGIVVAILALIFAVMTRYWQYGEIVRIFNANTPDSRIIFNIVMVASFLVLWAFYGFFMWIVFELGRWKREKYLQFIRFFLIYFSVQCVILFLIWPGMYRQDEICILIFGLSDMKVYWLQSLFTQVFYWLALAMFPYLASVTFFQIVLISLLAGATLHITWKNCIHKRLAYLLYIPFLFLPVLDNNQFALRNSQIAWVFLFLVVSVYFEYKKYQMISPKKMLEFLFIAVFIGVWKTEFLYFVPCLILLFFLTNYKNMKWKSLIAIPFVLVVYFVLTLPNRMWETGTDGYVLTSLLTPASGIITDYYGAYDERIQDDLAVIDAWLPLEEIKDTTVYFNIPDVYWEKGIVESKRQVKDLFKALLSVCVHYPMDYIQNRLYVYQWTNGFIPNVINHGNSTMVKELFDVDGVDLYYRYFRFTSLGHEALREQVIKFLGCRQQENYYHTTIAYHIVYNSFISFVLLIAITIWQWIRKNRFQALLFGAVILQVPIIFLFAPSTMFMYYMPFYLTSYSLIMLVIIQKIDCKLK